MENTSAIVIAFIFVLTIWIIVIFAIKKVGLFEERKKVKYDEYYLDIAFRQMGYTKNEKTNYDYYKHISDRTTFRYTLSPYGLTAALEFDERYQLKEEQSNQISRTIKDLIDNNQINNSIEFTGVSNGSVMLIVKPDETLDSYILDKLEIILNELVSIVEPNLN